MSWITQYRQASFRNVNFLVSQHEATGGRRIATHEFPQQDMPYSQDMGLRAKRFRIDAYVLGDNYFAERNKVIDALEKKGRGTLVHPYLGSHQVICVDYRIRETVAETRIARFTIDFVQAGDIQFPKDVLDVQASILTGREAVLAAINNWFLATYAIAHKPYNVVQNARDTVDAGITAINNVRKIVQTQPQFKAVVQDSLDDVVNLTADAIELSETTTQLLSFGTLPTDIFRATAENARWQFEELKKLFSFPPVKYKGSDDPAFIYSQMYSFSALAIASGLTVVMEYESFNYADELVDIIIAEIDDVIAIKGLDDNISVSFKDLQKIIIESIVEKGVDLPRLSIVVMPQSKPALVLAHDLYGSIEQEEDILTRNKVGHPGFVPGGQSIEVLLSA